MSVTGGLIPVGYQVFINPASGLPAISGSLYSYAAGTSTPLATYTDATLGTPNTNPLVLDVNGGGTVWVNPSTGYKYILKDSSGNTLWTRDQVYAGASPGAIGAQQIANGAVGTTQMAAGAVTTTILGASAVETSNIATGAVTGGATGSIGTGTIEEVNFDQNIDMSGLTRMIEVVYKSRYDLSGESMEVVPQYPWRAPLLLSNPGTLPPGQALGTTFSACGRFLAVASNTTPFIDIYARSGATFTKLPDPGTLPAAGAFYCKFSPKADFLIVSHATTPYVTIYQRQGNTFTKLSNPGTLPASTSYGISWSPNGEFVIVTHASSTFFKCYEVIGTTFTDISSTCGISGIGSTNTAVSWAPDSQYVAITNSGGSVGVFQRFGTGGSSFSSSAAPTLPALHSFNAGNMAFSPDGQVLAVGVTATPFIALFTFSGGSFAAIPNPSTLPGATVTSVAWSPNSAYLAVGLVSAPYLIIYRRSGTTFTAMTAPSNPLASEVNDMSWSPDNQFLAAATTSTPYVNVYQTSSPTLPTNALLWTRSLTNV